MRLPFEAEAARELEATATLYERERTSFGGLFFDEVKRKVGQAADLPRSGVAVSDLDGKRDVRLFAMRRFPYLVVTAIVNGRRAVVALAHQRRQPGYWRDRV